MWCHVSAGPGLRGAVAEGWSWSEFQASLNCRVRSCQNIQPSKNKEEKEKEEEEEAARGVTMTNSSWEVTP